MKAPLYYLHKKTQEVKLTFDMIARATKFITRADDRTKTVGNKNTKFLIHAIEQELEANSRKPVFIDHDFMTKITDCKNDQNAILLKRLSDIFASDYKHCIRYKGKLGNRGYMVQYTETGRERLENPELFYDVNNELKQQKAKVLRPIKIGAYADKNRCTTYKEKEIEDIPQGYISSISREKKECVRAGSIETSPDAALPNLRGSSTGEFLIQPHESEASEPTDLAKTIKPRLVITAAMQTGTAQLPLPLQASGLAMGEVSTISTKPVPLPTAEQERDQFRQHRDRKHQQSDNEPKPLGATILSLIPRSILEDTTAVTKTHQKGVDFQSRVETLPSCSTLEPSIDTRIEPKMKDIEIGLDTTDEIPVHGVAIPEHEQWREIKQEIVETYDHPADKMEVRSFLDGLEGTEDVENKIINLSGSSFEIGWIKKRHFKTFAASFYKTLPDYTFQFKETK